MRKQQVLELGILSLLTVGIYAVYWYVKTKGQLVKKGHDIPTSWLLVVPIANLYWLWRYLEATEKESKGKVYALLYMLIGLFINPIMTMLLLQDQYNKLK